MKVLHYSLLVALLGVLFWTALSIARFHTTSFDGSMNAQVAQSLARHGQYATTYNSVTEFNHIIQTGIPVLGPTALLFKIFGESVLTALMTNVLYLVGFGIMAYVAVRLVAGRWFGLMALAAVTFSGALYQHGMGLLGELPALMFILLSIILVTVAIRREHWRWYVAAGAAFGLAFLTKTVALIALPALALAWATSHPWKKLHEWYRVAAYLAGAALPVALFEAYKLRVLGWTAYLIWWRSQGESIAQQAGVAEGLPDTESLREKVTSSLTSLDANFFSAGKVALIIAAIVVVVSVVYLLVVLRKSEMFTRQKRFVSMAVVTAATTYLVWWLAITPSSKTFARRVVDGVFLLELAVFMLIGLLTHLVIKGRVRRQRIFAGALAGLLLAAMAQHVYVNASDWQIMREPTDVRMQAEAVAEKIASLPPEATIYGVGWWQSPLLSFLSGRTFLEIKSHVRDQGDIDLSQAYLAVDREARRIPLGWSEVTHILDLYESEQVAGQDLYQLYRLTKVR